jgi:dihydroorotase-like cyclic amidohydrolase
VPTVYDAAFHAGLTTAEIDWVAITRPGTINWSFAEIVDPTAVLPREMVAAGVATEKEILAVAEKKPVVGTNVEPPKRLNAAERDELWTRAASFVFTQHKPNLLMFHPLNTDGQHHRYGPGSPEGRTALELAGETGCSLHIVHVSSPEGIALITAARAQRVDVTAETCPHYLLLNDKDVTKLGAAGKCAPPIRDEKNRLALWTELRAGRIHTVGSDHSPAPPAMKTSKNFFEIWGGIGGVQHGAQLLMNECAATFENDLPTLAAVLARNVARRFRIEERKGSIALGRDADFSIFSLREPEKISTDDLWTRHRTSAYVGRKNRTHISHTFVRGQAAWRDGRLALPSPRAEFLRPVGPL